MCRFVVHCTRSRAWVRIPRVGALHSSLHYWHCPPREASPNFCARYLARDLYYMAPPSESSAPANFHLASRHSVFVSSAHRLSRRTADPRAKLFVFCFARHPVRSPSSRSSQLVTVVNTLLPYSPPPLRRHLRVVCFGCFALRGRDPHRVVLLRITASLLAVGLPSLVSFSNRLVVGSPPCVSCYRVPSSYLIVSSVSFRCERRVFRTFYFSGAVTSFVEWGVPSASLGVSSNACLHRVVVTPISAWRRTVVRSI